MIDRLLFTLKGSKQIMMKLVGFYVLQAFLIIGQAISLASLLTNLWAGYSLASEWGWLLGFAGCFIGRHVINWLDTVILDNYARKTAQKLRQQLLAKLFKLGPRLVQQQGTGNIVTLTLDGISEVENYINLLFSKFVSMMIIPVMILVVCFWLDWISGVVMLLVYPLIILFMIILGYAAKAKADRQYTSFQVLSNHFIDSLRGIDTLKYFGLSKRYSKSIFRSSERFRKSTMSVIRVAMLSTFALDFFTTLSIAVLAVFLGLRLIDGRLLLFPALGILILAPEYFMPIRNFANDYHATLNGKNSFHAVEKILHEEVPPEPHVDIKQWQDDSQLQLNEVEFQYQHGSRLAPVNLKLHGFQKIGIVGMSGAGKTTLINLLGGFLQPTDGTIKIQEQTVKTLNIGDWQKQIIYIPQDPYIFDDTLRNNISFYTPNVSQAQIEKAVKMMGLGSLVAELPNGLDTMIGKGHRQLSGGQAQRIALARAFLDQSRRVLILDEPTAHLDIETELELKERMIPIMKDHLVIFATHRLHWMKQMDYIVVMKHGQVIEQGTYDQLMTKPGYFTDLIFDRSKEGK
ncbi:thiol reductant ABC exporter subunit CydD [Limosilactobacillus fastidiosus]|uniref:Thiol reductant ABC exporter subunit CydD n=1 Tax=Limosilactobacillus fastidiosus TaxID=2759855 RepID=A0A7W3TZ68_9LACO|nr:thiol reductant ABC exporter subunit CydD [Limosilactobacillus fastidiosus]MBB1063062.1 thiol reductant ABC exporter subunit CydD [Limosilactobacillus fastidiosus]MBB1085685.1 thiol reductant ABC exporter subunit CydD [Limosilactobacillus fastidiosus]MCD7083857.1 thiol reductant ABC exporter subunit CydD [Limosilactobacillus fastidiosus]MCD7086164.1 thiol reductant ABC exporter subunit CydD [Limosilactobacillus fastidiosus]MCD7114025.1 thiol reductant ABC exporter subunit CydD [Limosilactob